MTIQALRLNNGVTFPTVGLGCWFGVPGTWKHEDAAKMVSEAFKAGYRHIDTARMYDTEKATGLAFRDSGLAREDVFITTKLNQQGHFDVKKGFERSMKELDMGYIDLYLMHWPQAQDENDKVIPYGHSPTFVEVWKEMEKLLDTGKVRAIGVSNFSVKNLEILLKEAKVVPAVNQVECHLYLPQERLHEYCAKKGIVLTAYSPLAPTRHVPSPVLADPTVVKLAEKYNKSAGTILLSWLVQRGNWSVIPKSSNPERMRQNLDLITLSDFDFQALQKVHEEPGKLKHVDEMGRDDWDDDHLVVGWTQDEMGWLPKN